MSQFTEATAAPDHIEYLDTAATIGSVYKGQFLDRLDVARGQVVLDIGCGPGTDLGTLADMVGPTGAVIGVDRDPRMVTTARERMGVRGNVEVRAGDVHDLPCGDHQVDRVRADRVLQHVDSPLRAIAQAHRVLRPGGLFGASEPDWDTLAIDSVDLSVSRAFSSYVVSAFRHPTVGRRLARLATEVGFTVRTVDVVAMVFRDFATAEQILGLRRNTARAVIAGHMSESVAVEWLDSLAHGPFLAYFSLVMMTAVAE